MSQLNFNFNNKTNYSIANFIVANANSSAYSFIINYNNKETNPEKVFAISGEKGCGKTHLAHIWQEITNAKFISKEIINDIEFSTITKKLTDFIEKNNSYILEDIEDITNENILLYIINTINERESNLLITSQIPLKNINFQIADLKSRVQNILNFVIDNPDEELIRILLIKQFSDYQLSVENNVIDFLIPRINRSFIEVNKIVKIIKDNFADKRVTIPLIKDLGLI